MSLLQMSHSDGVDVSACLMPLCLAFSHSSIILYRRGDVHLDDCHLFAEGIKKKKKHGSFLQDGLRLLEDFMIYIMEIIHSSVWEIVASSTLAYGLCFYLCLYSFIV